MRFTNGDHDIGIVELSTVVYHWNGGNSEVNYIDTCSHESGGNGSFDHLGGHIQIPAYHHSFFRTNIIPYNSPQVRGEFIGDLKINNSPNILHEP